MCCTAICPAGGLLGHGGRPLDLGNHETRRLAEIAEAGQADTALVAELYERDKLFPNIDYRWFGDREGSDALLPDYCPIF